MRIEIIYDNIIFNLQDSGGISVVWKELLQRALEDKGLITRFIDGPSRNMFRKQLAIPGDLIINDPISKLPFNRYLNPFRIKGKGLFHSSYYRTINSDDFINITTVHDFTYEYFRRGVPRIVHEFQKGHAINNSNRIICVSNNTKKDLLRFHPRVKESCIRVIYNGVDNSYSPIKEKNENDIRKLFPFSSGEYVVYIGDRKSPYKNFRQAAEACSRLKLPIVIIGGGPLTKGESAFLSEKPGDGKYSHLMGISNKEVNTIYNHALCLLYPSLYEGFGIPVVEAQKAGCPVICANSSSIPEVAGAGAYILDDISQESISDTIKQIIKFPSERERIIQRGFRNADNFSWDKCYLETRRVYQEIAEETES